MDGKLSREEQQTLLRLAREAMEYGVRGKSLPPLNESKLSLNLRKEGASFITLTIRGKLRGCIGVLEAYQSLAIDVREHAIAAALEDPRFPPVREDELGLIQIEVSHLTRPIPLDYKNADDLLAKLRPNIDGVLLRDGMHRATFLPQVWHKIPKPAQFMENLCRKMGVDKHAWRNRHMDVLVYQVEEFHE